MTPPGLMALRRTAPAAALLALLAAAGCGPDPFSPSAYRDLIQARARWRAFGFTHYLVESRTYCFCPVELSHWTRLAVRDNGIAGVEAVDPAFPILPATSPGTWRTVDQLFDQLEQLWRDPGYVTGVVMRFDPALGYPTEISISCEAVADCGSTTNLRNLTPVSGVGAAGGALRGGTRSPGRAGAGTRTRR